MAFLRHGHVRHEVWMCEKIYECVSDAELEMMRLIMPMIGANVGECKSNFQTIVNQMSDPSRMRAGRTTPRRPTSA